MFTIPFKREHWPHCDYIFNLYLKMKGRLLFPNVSGIFIFKGEHSPQYDYICSHCVSKTSLSIWRTLMPRFLRCVFFLLHCNNYTTRRICGIKQVIIVPFSCWLPTMFTLFPSRAITSFLHFSYWDITFAQCVTKCRGINCYYKHQSSSLPASFLWLPFFL